VGGAAICAGQSVTFNSSAVNGGSAPGYSWRINGNTFSGNTGSSFTSTTLQNGDQVSLVLSSNASCPFPAQATSSSISMVVNPVLVPTVNITSNTGSNQTCAGNTLILTANASNPGDSPNYQWFQNGSPLTGETNSTFTIPSNLTGSTGFTVQLTSNAICVNPTQVTSASYNVTVVSNVAPTVSVTSTLGTGPVCVGTSITFTASPVNGGTSPTFQWQKNNTDIPGQTGSVFTSTTLANNDQITVRMTSNDPCASTPTATSQPVTVSIVSTLPTSVTATSSVSGNTICAGTSVTFTANPVNGGSNPAYQWSVNGVTQAGETESTFTTSSLSNNAQVRVRLTSSYSCATPTTVTSSPVVMTVSPSVTPTLAVISTQGNFACAGSSILLVANYTNGGSNPQFQWYFNGSPLTDSNNDSLLTPTGFAGTNNYTVEITSNASCVNPPTVLSSAYTVSVAANVTPSVFVNSSVPGNTLCNGQSVTFTANPTNGGTAPLYQWRINGVNVAGQTSPTFTTSSLSNNDVVTVRLKTSITCSSPDTGISNPQTMTITPNSPAAVTVTNNLASNTTCNGQNVVFTANPVNGGTNPSYQWILNGADLPGQTNPTWSSFTLANGNQVSVRITSNSACATPNTATSTPVVMTVNPTVTPLVSLSSNPTGVSFCAGTTIQMTAIPENGGTAPVYEWKVNNNVVPGQTGSVLNFVLTTPSTVTATLISNAACANPVQVTSGGQLFSVTPPQVVTAQADTAVCEATGSFQLTASPAGGSWSGTGVSSTGSYTPGSTGSTKVYYSVPANGNLCAGTDSVLITVKARPVITFSNQGPFCQTAPAVQLTANPTGGTWTGTGVTTSGLFTPSTAGAGQTSVLYLANVNGCSSSKVLSIQVNAPPTVDVGGNETVCFSTDAFQLNGLPAGGTWSGDGVDADGTFNPGFVTPGSTNNLTYTVTVNGCTASKTKQIAVTDFGSPLNVNAGTDQTVCISDAAFVLQGITGAGGSWTGTGVSPDGIFNPTISGTGSFTLTYTVSFTQSPTCSGSDTKIVTVLAAPQAPSVQGDTVCRSGAATLVANGTAAAFNWYTTSSGGNPIIGQASPSFTTPILNSTTTYYVSQKAGSCESPRTAVVAYVNNFNNAAFSNNAGLLTSEPSNGQGYQWLLSGNPITGAINSSYTPLVSGDYSVIIRLDGCADTSAQQYVLVTGVNESNGQNPWTLIPNPVQTDLHIKAEGLTEIRVINMLGQCVKTKLSDIGPVTTMWMGDMPDGVYRIELRGPDRMEMQMIIVRK